MSRIIHFYETYYSWFIRLHSTWQKHIRVIPFKNIWTGRDCTIKQLGRELSTLFLVCRRLSAMFLNGVFASVKQNKALQVKPAVLGIILQFIL